MTSLSPRDVDEEVDLDDIISSPGAVVPRSLLLTLGGEEDVEEAADRDPLVLPIGELAVVGVFVLTGLRDSDDGILVWGSRLLEKEPSDVLGDDADDVLGNPDGIGVPGVLAVEGVGVKAGAWVTAVGLVDVGTGIPARTGAVSSGALVGDTPEGVVDGFDVAVGVVAPGTLGVAEDEVAGTWVAIPVVDAGLVVGV
ncbi:unnamed protein product [Phytophthora lilii]|uniref:Unnamed protein product n=1 Tax=Phytophthora lilii TaxID=2077276 RepID=A0A9W6XGJ4_9STRA|nr:unnamed protein product [Phytophthora lilii]